MNENEYTVEDFVDVFRKKWTLFILVELFSGNKRFQDFQDSSPGISPKVLNDTLIELEKFGLIDKKLIQEKPKLTEYSLTDKGNDSKKFIKEFSQYISMYSNSSDGRCQSKELIDNL